MKSKSEIKHTPTPIPWKLHNLWDVSGMVKNVIHQDCQPGKMFKSDTTVICTFPPAIQNRENARLIVTAVNEYAALNAVAEVLQEVVGRFPLDGIRSTKEFKCMCNQFLDTGDCRHERAKNTLANLAAIRKGAQ